MNDKFSECQTPFTKCWCESASGRMNNPNCQSLMPSVPIDDTVFIVIMLFLGMCCFFLRPTKLK